MMRQKEYGLTLPEMLVSLAILAGISVVISPVIRNTVQATSRIQVQTKQIEDLRTANQLLRDFGGKAIWAEAGTPELHADGTQLRFQFGTYDPEGRPATLYLKPSLNGPGLSIELKDLHAPRNIQYEATVLMDISQISFSYFGRLDRRQEPNWYQSWSLARPPQLVRVKGIMTNGTPYLLDIMMAGQAPLVCEFDPVSRICRNV